MAIFEMNHSDTQSESHTRFYQSDEYDGKTFQMEETFTGYVLSKYERNGYDDSDFVAVVWSEQDQTIKHIEYASTRGWSYPNHASIDATEEVKEKALAHRIAVARASAIIRDIEESTKPSTGKIVRVIKGRKIAKGTIGKITSITENAYDKYNPCVTLRIDTDKGVSFQRTYAENLEVVNPGAYTDADKAADTAEYYVMCNKEYWR